MSGPNCKFEDFGDFDSNDESDDPDNVSSGNRPDYKKNEATNLMKAAGDRSCTEENMDKTDESGDSAKKDEKASNRNSNSRRSPSSRRKEKRNPNILKEKRLKRGDTNFVKSRDPNRQSWYEPSKSQKTTFSNVAVVCKFRGSENIQTFREKLADSKESFCSEAPFPPGLDAKKAKPILRKK